MPYTRSLYCRPCQPGSYSQASGATSCSACQPGKSCLRAFKGRQVLGVGVQCLYIHLKASRKICCKESRGCVTREQAHASASHAREIFHCSSNGFCFSCDPFPSSLPAVTVKALVGRRGFRVQAVSLLLSPKFPNCLYPCINSRTHIDLMAHVSWRLFQKLLRCNGLCKVSAGHVLITTRQVHFDPSDLEHSLHLNFRMVGRSWRLPALPPWAHHQLRGAY